MTATTNNARMTLVQIGEDPARKLLLSAAEIAALEARFAQAIEAAAPAAAPPEGLATEIPTFTGSDADILKSGQASAPERPAPAPIWQNQRLLIGLCGLLLTALIIVITRIAEGYAPAPARALALSTAVVTRPTTAAPAPATPTTAATTVATAPTVVAYFDYSDLASSTTITTSGILRVEGSAGADWRLVALSAGRASVWIASGDVPAGVPAAEPLPDLAPRPTAPVQRQPASSSGGSSSGGSAAETAPTSAALSCETEADYRRFTSQHDVTRPNANGTTDYIGVASGQSCYSQDEADTRAAAREQVVLAERKANPVATPLPSATPMPLTQATPSR